MLVSEDLDTWSWLNHNDLLHTINVVLGIMGKRE